MCSLDHGGSRFSDSQEAGDARAHFTVELPDGGPFERIAFVRHELDAVEWVCARSRSLCRGHEAQEECGGGRFQRTTEGERERDSTKAVPPHLGGMCLQLSRRYGLHAWHKNAEGSK